MMGSRISYIIDAQTTPYSFIPLPGVVEYFDRSFVAGEEEDLFQTSLQVEPREELKDNKKEKETTNTSKLESNLFRFHHL